MVFRDEGAANRSKLIHAAVVPPANVADGAVSSDLLRGRETRAWGDQACRGRQAVLRRQAPINRRGRYRRVVIVWAKTVLSRRCRPRAYPRESEGRASDRC
jgi:hypothetical protein